MKNRGKGMGGVHKKETTKREWEKKNERRGKCSIKKIEIEQIKARKAKQ